MEETNSTDEKNNIVKNLNGENQISIDDIEPMSNNSKMLAKNCGPYAPLQRLPFNPQGYADDSIVSTGYDDLPMDSVSRGDWTDSSVGYKFGRA